MGGAELVLDPQGDVGIFLQEGLRILAALADALIGALTGHGWGTWRQGIRDANAAAEEFEEESTDEEVTEESVEEPTDGSAEESTEEAPAEDAAPDAAPQE